MAYTVAEMRAKLEATTPSGAYLESQRNAFQVKPTSAPQALPVAPTDADPFAGWLDPTPAQNEATETATAPVDPFAALLGEEAPPVAPPPPAVQVVEAPKRGRGRPAKQPVQMAADPAIDAPIPYSVTSPEVVAPVAPAVVARPELLPGPTREQKVEALLSALRDLLMDL